MRGNFRQFSNKNVHIWDPFFPLLFPKDSESLKILDIRLREVGAKRPLKKTENWRRSKKSEWSGEKKTFLWRNFWQFSNKNVHIWDHFFLLLFPKDSESVKILDIQLREVGAKRPLNGTSKVNRRTDGQTDGRTDRRTNRLIESIGPEGRCFENYLGRKFKLFLMFKPEAWAKYMAEHKVWSSCRITYFLYNHFFQKRTHKEVSRYLKQYNMLINSIL